MKLARSLAAAGLMAASLSAQAGLISLVGGSGTNVDAGPPQTFTITTTAAGTITDLDVVAASYNAEQSLSAFNGLALAGT